MMYIIALLLTSNVVSGMEQVQDIPFPVQLYQWSDENFDDQWLKLANAAGQIFLQLNRISDEDNVYEHRTDNHILLIYDTQTWQAVRQFEANILSSEIELKMLYCDISVGGSLQSPNDLLKTFSTKIELTSVLIFSSNVTFITDILLLLSTDPEYKWTSFLHTTEWTVVTTQGGVCSRDYTI